MDTVTFNSAQARVAARERLSILVTGGAGFLGSHLCERLIEQGHRVICLDNLETGRLQLISFKKGLYFRLTDHVSEYMLPGYAFPEGQGQLARFQDMRSTSKDAAVADRVERVVPYYFDTNTSAPS